MDSTEKTLQLSEKTNQLIISCNRCAAELHEANKTEEGRCRLRRKIIAEMGKVSKIRRELAELRNAANAQ